jgi:hypothetical protein
MEKLKMFEKLSVVALASAALSFGQMTNMGYPPTYPSNAGQPQRDNIVSPGTVNYVEGQVSLDGQPLGGAGRVVLQPGNALATGGSGFAEVLLTPGAFLRVGPNSQLHFTSVGLAATQVQLDRGMANVEVDQFIQGTRLAVVMNGATAQVEKTGLYNFDANQQTVKVLDGKANVALTAAGSKSIGKGDELLLASEKERGKGAGPLCVE